MPTKNTPSRTTRSEAKVRVQNASRSRRLPAPARFRAWVRATVTGAAEVTVRLVGTAEGRRLNLTYRGKDYATNVLTFAYGKRAGDIVICPAVVAREAGQQGKPLEQHYAHLTVHGVLHMRGYDHERPADAARMERAEIRILRQLGHPNPYLV